MRIVRADDSYLVGLIGTGVVPSPTPALHEHEADAQGLRYLYRVLDLPSLGLGVERVGELVRSAALLGFTGLNVTHPAKQAVIPFVDELDPVAEALGAVNTITVEDDGRLIGHNTDVEAFGAPITRALGARSLGRVLQLGAGGAGAATAYAVLARGAQSLTVTDPDPDRSCALAKRMQRLFPDRSIGTLTGAEVPAAVAEADGVVNASPVGSAILPGLPLDPDSLRPDHWVADVIYRPIRTALVEAAAERGCVALGGGGMMVGQAAESFRVFTGRRADEQRMAARFEELLSSVG